MIILRKFGLTALIASAALYAQPKSGPGWQTYGGDKAFTRYSPLDQINRENVKNLHVRLAAACRRSADHGQVPGSQRRRIISAALPS